MKKKWLALFLFLCLCASLSACVVLPQEGGAIDTPTDSSAENSVVSVSDSPGTESNPGSFEQNTESMEDDPMIPVQMAFSVDLLQDTAEKEAGKNVMVSPLSLALSLSLLANGASGETQAQILDALGGGTPEERNEFLKEYVALLSAEESRFSAPGDEGILNTANGIWYRPGVLQPDGTFLQTAESYYGASMNPSSFDASAVKEINGWVEEHTLGQIEELISEFPEDLQLYLVNALGFEAKWANQNTRGPLPQGVFHSSDGEEQPVEWLSEKIVRSYFEVAGGRGAVRTLRGNYEFAAILPPDGMDVSDFVKRLDGEALRSALSQRSETALLRIPKFSFDSQVSLNDFLLSRGMTDAFDAQKADLSGMGAKSPLAVGEVRQKTVIDVNEYGVTAAAVGEILVGAAFMEQIQDVTLDRPFVFLIVDDEYYLPVFMGIVTSVE